MAKEDRGFARMNKDKQFEICSKGGVAVHKKGTAHEWTADEARQAGRLGGFVSYLSAAEREKIKAMKCGPEKTAYIMRLMDAKAKEKANRGR